MSLRFNNVASAAAWLDTVKPNWFKIVDTDILDMHSVRFCVLGQVFKEEGRDSWMTNGYDWAIEKFNISGSSYTVFGNSQPLWLEEIKTRLNKVDDKVVAGHYDNVSDAARRLDAIKPNWYSENNIKVSRINFAKPETTILGLVYSLDSLLYREHGTKNGHEYGIRVLGFSGKAFEGNAQEWEREIMNRRNHARTVTFSSINWAPVDNTPKPLRDSSKLDLVIHPDGTVTGKLK